MSVVEQEFLGIDQRPDQILHVVLAGPLWIQGLTFRYYPIGVYTLPKHLDEKVARLHLAAVNVNLTELRPDQAAYIGVKVEGPYKPEHYRY